MRTLLLVAATVLALVGVPARPTSACPAPSIPLYPGARPPPGLSGPELPVSSGNMFIATDDSLANVQRFYYTRLPNEGWEPVTQLPGQYIEQFGGQGGSTTPVGGPQGVLEFSRNAGHERVRIVGQASGYSIYVACID